MSIETRLRETGPRGGGGGGSSSNSGGLAGTGAYFILGSANASLPFSSVIQAGTSVSLSYSGTNLFVSSFSAGLLGTGGLTLTAGSSVTIVSDATSIYINAITNAGSSSAGLAGTGAFYLLQTSGNGTLPFSKRISAGSSVTTHTDATTFYINAITNAASSVVYAPTGGFYLAYTSDASLTAELILRAGSSVTTHTDSTFFYINATTSGGSSNSAGLAGTGPFYVLTSGNSTLPNSVAITKLQNAWVPLGPQQAKLYASTSAARIDAGTPTWRLLFSPTTQQYGVWQFIVPPDYGTSPFCRIAWSSDSSLAVAKTVTWLVDQWGMADNQGRASSIYADTFGGTNSISVALSAGYSSGTIMILTIPLATTVSLAASRLTSIRLSSSAGNVTGNQELVGMSFEYLRS